MRISPSKDLIPLALITHYIFLIFFALFPYFGQALGARADLSAPPSALTPSVSTTSKVRAIYEEATETAGLAVTSTSSVSSRNGVGPTPTLVAGMTTFDTAPSVTILVNTTPTSSSAVSSGASTNSILATVSIVTAITLALIAIWQGARYPWREHKKRMGALDIEYTAAEEALERQRNEARQGQPGPEIELQGTEAGQAGVSRTHGLTRLRPWSALALGLGLS
ncbi:hypothetical protein FRB93_000873 [Tulasnella sp. JGI-2019a]|nr:hypothetical protein FRB93_000873 [Tulasnella sp. JGI-2019a]